MATERNWLLRKFETLITIDADLRNFIVLTAFLLLSDSLLSWTLAMNEIAFISDGIYRQLSYMALLFLLQLGVVQGYYRGIPREKSGDTNLYNVRVGLYRGISPWK